MDTTLVDLLFFTTFYLHGKMYSALVQLVICTWANSCKEGAVMNERSWYLSLELLNILE